MARNVSFERYLNMLAERSIGNTHLLRRNVNQRRNGMEDLYGICYSGNGDANTPFSFYISLSPDYVYLQRFAFKFVIRPYVTSVSGGTDPQTVTVDPTQITVDGNFNVSPNPHGHTTQQHTHNVIKGISTVDTTSTYWGVRVAGIDITAELMAQHDGQWISGEGIYPNGELVGGNSFYDILDVASMLTALGEYNKREAILASGFKKVEIFSDAPFGVDCYVYLKYSAVGR